MTRYTLNKHFDWISWSITQTFFFRTLQKKPNKRWNIPQTHSLHFQQVWGCGRLCCQTCYDMASWYGWWWCHFGCQVSVSSETLTAGTSWVPIVIYSGYTHGYGAGLWNWQQDMCCYEENLMFSRIVLVYAVAEQWTLVASLSVCFCVVCTKRAADIIFEATLLLFFAIKATLRKITRLKSNME